MRRGPCAALAPLALVVLALAGCERDAVPPPVTVSTAWREALAAMPEPERPEMPGPDDVDAWRERQALQEADAPAIAAQTLAQIPIELRERTLGGVPVLELRPRALRDGDDRAVVYLHGGGYVAGSARGSLPVSARIADATGLVVLSVDYPLAPGARWRRVVDDVVAVLAALPGDGHPLPRVALWGDSAGGGLAAGATLAARDRGLALPAALVLISPWADLTDAGDSHATLAHVERAYRYEDHLAPAAAAYAPPPEQSHPYVSPVYGDFAKGYPPTLIQGGTREIFLSGFVRLYQAIDAAGGRAKLDLYEAMPHMFPVRLPDAPEGRLAFDKAVRFVDRHTRAGTPGDP